MCDPSVPFNCDNYCRQMVGAGGDCGPGPWLYPTSEACLARCRQFSRGPEDTLGDTLECRVWAINVGEQSLVDGAKALYCPNAGASGGSLCTDAVRDGSVSQCSLYCKLRRQFCPARYLVAGGAYSGCGAQCAAYSAGELACRMKHVLIAARSTVPEIHCDHDTLCASAGLAAATRRGHGHAVLGRVVGMVKARLAAAGDVESHAGGEESDGEHIGL